MCDDDEFLSLIGNDFLPEVFSKGTVSSVGAAETSEKFRSISTKLEDNQSCPAISEDINAQNGWASHQKSTVFHNTSDNDVAVITSTPEDSEVFACQQKHDACPLSRHMPNMHLQSQLKLNGFKVNPSPLSKRCSGPAKISLSSNNADSYKRKQRNDEPTIFIKKKLSVGFSNPAGQEHQPATVSLRQEVTRPLQIVCLSGDSVKKRKFPGPAGLLPDLRNSSTVSLTYDDSVVDGKPHLGKQGDVHLCSQRSANAFEHGTWRQMLEDLQLDQNSPSCLLSEFNIKWLLGRASLKGHVSLKKAPFLVVMIHYLDVTHLDATAVFRDKSGEMNGTIASAVLEEYRQSLLINSVLVLKDVCVLSPSSKRFPLSCSDSSKRHYLNVTLSSIMKIYSTCSLNSVSVITLTPFNKGDFEKRLWSHKSSSSMLIEEEEESLDSRKASEPLFTNVTGEHRVQSSPRYHLDNCSLTPRIVQIPFHSCSSKFLVRPQLLTFPSEKRTERLQKPSSPYHLKLCNPSQSSQHCSSPSSHQVFSPVLNPGNVSVSEEPVQRSHKSLNNGSNAKPFVFKALEQISESQLNSSGGSHNESKLALGSSVCRQTSFNYDDEQAVDDILSSLDMEEFLKES